MNAPIRMPWLMNVALAYEGDDCLDWPYSLRGQYPALCGGYGHVKLCELAHGPRPTPEHEAEHICGRSCCMNKRHLRWATHLENCQRRTEHGTQLIGERHNLAKLTNTDVRAILTAPRNYGSGAALARRYGVSPALICIIRKRKVWRHL